MNRHFSEHRHRYAFAMTYCLQKEKVENDEVLGGSDFDNFFPIVSLTSMSCVRWRGENTKAVLKSGREHLSLKTRII